MNHSPESLVFDLPVARPNIIKVIGVGGAGGNAVSHMCKMGIHEVEFLLCNTDYQALERSPVPMRLQLGPNLTAGRGAGNRPEVGREAALETLEDLRAHLGEQTRMVFITAGLGGGTGTGAAPVIARLCHELNILTVGIVTLPFSFEGKKRINQAAEGLEQLRAHCDTILVISNDKVREVYGNLPIDEAFGRADDVLAIAAKGIAEIITITGEINVDFSDVETVLRNSGKAVMGSGWGTGADRAMNAIREALNSPLLSDNDITGANSILLNLTSGQQTITLDEVGEINDYIQTVAGSDTNIIWGNCIDPALGDAVRATIIATGFAGGQTEMPRRILTPLMELNDVATPGATNSLEAAGSPTPVTAAPQVQYDARTGARIEMRDGKELFVHTLGQDKPLPAEESAAVPNTPVNGADVPGRTDFAVSPVGDSTTQGQGNAETDSKNGSPAEPKTLRQHLFGDNLPSKGLFGLLGNSGRKNEPSAGTPPNPPAEVLPDSMATAANGVVPAYGLPESGLTETTAASPANAQRTTAGIGIQGGSSTPPVSHAFVPTHGMGYPQGEQSASPRAVNPGNGVPVNGIPFAVNARSGISGNGIPGAVNAGNGISGNGIPGNGIPGAVNAGNGIQGNGNSGNGIPGNANSGNANSWNGIPGAVNAGNGISGNGISGNGISGNGISGNGTSGNGISGNGISGNANSGNGNSGNGISGIGNSGNGNSGNGILGNSNSGNANSGNGISGPAAPNEINPGSAATPPSGPNYVPPPVARPLQEDILGRSERRRQTLRGLSFRNHEGHGPGEVQSEPAFIRKGIQLSAVEPSDALPVSRFTLSESPEQRPEIRPNNAFLHDNVD